MKQTTWTRTQTHRQSQQTTAKQRGNHEIFKWSLYLSSYMYLLYSLIKTSNFLQHICTKIIFINKYITKSPWKNKIHFISKKYSWESVEFFWIRFYKNWWQCRFQEQESYLTNIWFQPPFRGILMFRRMEVDIIFFSDRGWRPGPGFALSLLCIVWGPRWLIKSPILTLEL